MSFEHAHGKYNVEGTLNNWFATNIAGAGLPPWMPSARCVYNWPQKDLISGYSGHAFALNHLGAMSVQQYEGRNTIGGSAGETRQGLWEINCWVSRQVAGERYTERLRHMGDMVTNLFMSARYGVEITNLYTSTAAPSGIGALVRLYDVEEMATLPDPNPDMMRRRFLVRYRWLERT